MNLILFESGEPGLDLSGSGESSRSANGSAITKADGILSCRDERAIHLLKVLHKKAGDSFDAGLIGGKLGKGIIKEIAETISFSLHLDTAPPPRVPLRICAGFPRPIQLRRMFRDLSSLGLEAVDLAGTELGEKSYRDTKLLSDGGARTALIEGAALARDTRLPVLAVYPCLEAWLKAQPWAAAYPSALLVAADNVLPAGSFSQLNTGAGSDGVQRLNGVGKAGDVQRLNGAGAVLAVGPERGWSSREREMLEAAGFMRLSMGARALRTETAAIAACILLMEKIGYL
jgi:16S rRNA U1498 N3-methylase RsmE